MMTDAMKTDPMKIDQRAYLAEHGMYRPDTEGDACGVGLARGARLQEEGREAHCGHGRRVEGQPLHGRRAGVGVVGAQRRVREERELER